MFYVERDQNNNIIHVSSVKTDIATEKLDAKSPEILTFLLSHSLADTNDRSEGAKQSLSNSDTDLIRILEDLVSVLMEKNLISLTDLPEAAQNKLLNRKHLRDTVTGDEPAQIINDDAIF